MQSLQIGFWVVALLVMLTLGFDSTSGFHDAANFIATVVSTCVLRPQTAVLFAAFVTVAARFAFQLKLAATVGKGIVEPDVVDQYVVFDAMMGGIVGASVAKAGAGRPVLGAMFTTVAFIVVLPVLGFVLADLYSLGHGGKDAQKTIGIIWPLLIASGAAASTDPRWPGCVIWSCSLAIGAGTLLGGWRIVKTKGQSITKLKPVGGFCAEPGGAMTLFVATALGASRCRPRTSSPVPSSALARCATRQKCAGAWPATSSGRGC